MSRTGKLAANSASASWPGGLALSSTRSVQGLPRCRQNSRTSSHEPFQRDTNDLKDLKDLRGWEERDVQTHSSRKA
jgi:hypothetical protein